MSEEVNINISLNNNENKVIITTSDRNVDLLHKKEIKLQNENNFPIGLGHSGLYVDNIQRFLTTVNRSNLRKYGIDTIFGEETQEACYRVFGTKDINVNQYSMIENFLVSINKYRKP